ncbi:MAG: DUF370 domain-containing protein [Ruminococcaceae bacterium]|nr:DUF370 domain-containing protein [Oscillospiraceae bacterium]
MKFINVGFNNMVNADRIIAVIASDSAPAKRLILDARDSGRSIDCTCGRKTRCVIITDSDHVILSALQNETISGRLAEHEDDGADEAEEI